MSFSHNEVDKHSTYAKSEIASATAELREWWISRRFARERNVALHQELSSRNFSGLSGPRADVPEAQAALWHDIVAGKPALPDSLSKNAKAMRGEMYLQTFADATDLDHPCRMPGMAFFRCLNDKAVAPRATREAACVGAFSAFDQCRASVKMEQDAALKNAIYAQDLSDRRAMAIFARRCSLQDELKQ